MGLNKCISFSLSLNNSICIWIYRQTLIPINKRYRYYCTCSMGAEYTTVFKTFDFTNTSNRDKIDIVKRKFNEYFQPRKLLKKQLTMFQAIVQHDSESVTQYITAVKQLATHCEFGSLKDRRIALQISNGVRDNKLKENCGKMIYLLINYYISAQCINSYMY